MLPLPPSSPLFPYTTLFRSARTFVGDAHARAAGGGARHAHVHRRGAARVLERVVDEVDDGELDGARVENDGGGDRKSTRLNSSHLGISYAVFCLKKKK